MTRLLTVLVLLATMMAWDVATSPADAGWSARSMVVEGKARTYTLYKPARRNQGDTLIAAFHGGGGTGAGFCAKADFEIERPDWFVVCLDAVDGAWGDPTDVAFAEAVIQKHKRARVVAVGHSLGGGMAHVLACAGVPDLDAIVMSAPGLPDTGCAAMPLGVLLLHGVAHEYNGSIGDGRVPYTCPAGLEACAQRDTPPGRVWPAARLVGEHWARLANCRGSVRVAHPDNAVIETATGCSDPIEAVEMTDGYHGWGGGPKTFLRPRPPSFPATAYIALWITNNL